jgi:hypothetical protein
LAALKARQGFDASVARIRESIAFRNSLLDLMIIHISRFIIIYFAYPLSLPRIAQPTAPPAASQISQEFRIKDQQKKPPKVDSSESSDY